MWLSFNFESRCMDSIFARFCAFVFIACACFVPAHAGVVKGSFQGIAYDSRVDATSPSATDFDGQVVTGTFVFDTAGLYPPDVHQPDFYFGFVQAGSLQLVFNAMGRAVAFGGDESGDAVFATNGSSGQTASFYPGYTFPYYFAGLQLAGPLLDGVDFASFRPGPVDLQNSFAYFFAGRDFGASVELTAVRFETNQVAEPSSGWLVLLGLVSLFTVAWWKTSAAASLFFARSTSDWFRG